MASSNVSDPYGVLTPEDFTSFQVQRQRVNDNYNIGTAQNDYQRSGLQLQYDQSVGDMKRAYAMQLRTLPGSFSKRNLLHSGLYEQAKSDFKTNWQAQQNNASQQFQHAKFGMDLAGTQLGDVRTSSLGEIDFKDSARRATAYNLRMNGIGV